MTDLAVPRAVPARLTWRPAVLRERRRETATATTLVLDVAGWSGHRAGQHVDVRLTAEDGYTTQRSYSIASAPVGEHLELTVQTVPGGEVSGFLADELPVGAAVEVRGPLGGWFVWDPVDDAPVLLVAGGSGLVPLMAMVRTRRAARSSAPFTVVASVRTEDDHLYGDELDGIAADGSGVTVRWHHTRRGPTVTGAPPARLAASDLAAVLEAAPARPTRTYVCGPTGFVEAVADALTLLGTDPASVRTERFGPTGE